MHMVKNFSDENSTAYAVGYKLSQLLSQGPTYKDLLMGEGKQLQTGNPARTSKMQQLKESLDQLLVNGARKLDKNGEIVPTGTLLDPNKQNATLTNAAYGLITPQFFKQLTQLHKRLTDLQNVDAQKTKKVKKKFEAFRKQWFQFNELFEKDSTNNPLLLIRNLKQAYQKRQSLLEVNDKAARGFKDFLNQQKNQASDITPYPSFISPREALFLEFYQDFPPSEQSKQTSKLNLKDAKLNNVQTLSSVIPTNTADWTSEQWQEHAYTLLKSLAQKDILKDLPPLVGQEDQIIYKQKQAYGNLMYEVLDSARQEQPPNLQLPMYQQLTSWHMNIANQQPQQANQQSAVDSLRDKLGMNNSPDLDRLHQLQSLLKTYKQALPSPETAPKSIQKSNTNVVRGALNVVLFDINKLIEKKDLQFQSNQTPRTSTSSTSTGQSGGEPNSRLTTEIAQDQRQAFQAVKDYLPATTNSSGPAQQQPFAYTSDQKAIYLNDFQQVSTESSASTDDLEHDYDNQQTASPQQIHYTVSQQPAHEQPSRQESIVQHLSQSSDEPTTYELEQDSEMSITAALKLTKQGYEKGKFVAYNNQYEVDISGINDTRSRRGAPQLSEFMSQAGISNSQRKSLTWQQYAYLQAVDLGLKPTNYNQETIDKTIQHAAHQLEQHNQQQEPDELTPGIQSRHKYS